MGRQERWKQYDSGSFLSWGYFSTFKHYFLDPAGGVWDSNRFAQTFDGLNAQGYKIENLGEEAELLRGDLESVGVFFRDYIHYVSAELTKLERFVGFVRDRADNLTSKPAETSLRDLIINIARRRDDAVLTTIRREFSNYKEDLATTIERFDRAVNEKINKVITDTDNKNQAILKVIDKILMFGQLPKLRELLDENEMLLLQLETDVTLEDTSDFAYTGTAVEIEDLFFHTWGEGTAEDAMHFTSKEDFLRKRPLIQELLNTLKDDIYRYNQYVNAGSLVTVNLEKGKKIPTLSNISNFIKRFYAENLENYKLEINRKNKAAIIDNRNSLLNDAKDVIRQGTQSVSRSSSAMLIEIASAKMALKRNLETMGEINKKFEEDTANLLENTGELIQEKVEQNKQEILNSLEAKSQGIIHNFEEKQSEISRNITASTDRYIETINQTHTKVQGEIDKQKLEVSGEIAEQKTRISGEIEAERTTIMTNLAGKNNEIIGNISSKEETALTNLIEKKDEVETFVNQQKIQILRNISEEFSLFKRDFNSTALSVKNEIIGERLALRNEQRDFESRKTDLNARISNLESKMDNISSEISNILATVTKILI